MQSPINLNEPSSVTATAVQPQTTAKRRWRRTLAALSFGPGTGIALLPLIAGLLPTVMFTVAPMAFGGPMPGGVAVAASASVALTVLLAIGGWSIGRGGARNLTHMANSTARLQDAAAVTLHQTLALDRISASIMLIDGENKITYLNKSVQSMLKAAENDLQQELPDFRVESLAGESIDIFGDGTLSRIGRSADSATPRRKRIQVGGRTFDVVASSFTDESGQALGTAIEWTDRT